MRTNRYNVYDKDEKLVLESASKNEIAEKLGIQPKVVWKAINSGKKINNTYTAVLQKNEYSNFTNEFKENFKKEWDRITILFRGYYVSKKGQA